MQLAIYMHLWNRQLNCKLYIGINFLLIIEQAKYDIASCGFVNHIQLLCQLHTNSLHVVITITNQSHRGSTYMYC